MRIAQVAPLFESVPPKYYGGTERIVSFLTEQLLRQGHDVTLFASGDSVTGAELISPCASSLRLAKNHIDDIAYHLVELEQVFSRAGEFDVIHSHIDYLTYPLARRCTTPVLTTLHGRMDMQELVPVYQTFAERPLVSISDSQRSPLSGANWIATIYHGLPRDLFHFHDQPGDYLAFLGRISREKRVDRAVRIAQRAGILLKVAAKVDPRDHDYYVQVAELLRSPGVEFIGEIRERQKNDFLGRARALVFPIEWPEPFGLVMIEAMACGTPVIAFRHGAVPEIIEHGLTGYIVDNEDQAVEAIKLLPRLSRREIRRRFEQRFTDYRMTREYLKLYERLMTANRIQSSVPHESFTAVSPQLTVASTLKAVGSQR